MICDQWKPYFAKTGLLCNIARDSPPKWELVADDAPLLFSPEKEFSAAFWEFTHIKVLPALQPTLKSPSIIKVRLPFNHYDPIE